MRAKTKTDALQKISAIAVPGDNGLAIVHVPRSWINNRRIWCMTQEHYEQLKGRHR